MTGGAGFIGSHLVRKLLDEGEQVTVLDNFSTGSRENLPQDAAVKCVEMDVNDASLAEVFDEGRFDAVVHLAGQTTVHISMESPALDGRENIIGSIHVLEQARRTGVQRVVFASTAASYGDVAEESLPIVESEPLHPMSFYGLSKVTVEHYLRLYQQSFGLDFVILRFANVYGERQGNGGEGGVISIFAKRLAEGRALTIYGDGEQTRDFIYAGDIAAAVGLKNTTTGDTLCDEKNPIVLESMEFPEPVIRVAIEPKTKAGQEKMDIALAKLAEEDPTFKAYTDEETGQTIIAGMGELHLEIIVDRLLREFRVEANVGRPQVSYKETVTKAATVDTRYARQTGGKGQFAHVKLTIEPNEPGKGYEFVNAITGGAIPKEFIPCVDQGIQGAMQSGVLAGYEVVDVKVTLLDGSYHEVDSSEMAFKICGSMAFKEACQKAGPTLLEPIMKVVVTAPESYMGDVMGDINARRGQIAGTDIRNGAAIVTANVPLASMFGYATDLRSKTQGRATYSMEPSHFVELPKSLQEKIIHGGN